MYIYMKVRFKAIFLEMYNRALLSFWFVVCVFFVVSFKLQSHRLTQREHLMC